MESPIERYLAAFRRRLRLEGPQRGRIVSEVEDHLRESELNVRRRGFAPPDAERLAVRKIGTPDAIAKGMNDEAARITGLPPRPHVVLAVIGIGFLFILLVFTLFVVFLWPRDSDPDDLLVAGRIEDFVVGQPVHFSEQAVWIVRIDRETFRALYDRDLLGCRIPWRPLGFSGLGYATDEGVFRDPCHGTAYDIEGRWLTGHHGIYHMRQFPVQVEDGEVAVELHPVEG